MFRLFLKFLGIGFVLFGMAYLSDFALTKLSSPSDAGVFLGWFLLLVALFGGLALIALLLKPRSKNERAKVIPISGTNDPGPK